MQKFQKYEQGLDKNPSFHKGIAKLYQKPNNGFEFSEGRLVEIPEYTYTTPLHKLSERSRKELLEGDKLEGVEFNENPLTYEQGNDGTHYQSGTAYKGENSEFDVPVCWRGTQMDYGIAHQLYLSSPVYQRPVASIQQAVKSGIWEVTGDDEEQAQEIQNAINSLEGGLNKFLTEAVYSLCVPGFGIWLRIHRADGSLRKLSFRRPNSLSKIIFDEAQQNIIAFEFQTTDGETYQIDARDCLVISANRLGDDLEGISPMRSAAPYIRAKQDLISIMMGGIELNATGMPVVEAGADYQPTDQDASKVARALDGRRAGTAQSIILPKGLTAKDLTPQAFPSTAQTLVEYFDQMISLPLSSEGALIGQGNHGSYALADVKDDQQLRVAIAVAHSIQDAFNGRDNSPTTGPMKTMLKAMKKDSSIMLAFSLGESEVPLKDILEAVKAGLVSITPQVQEHIAQRLKLPVQADEQPASEEDLEDVEAHEHDGCCNAHSTVSGLVKFSDDDLFDIAGARDAHTKAEKRVGRAFEGVAREHRNLWVELTQGAEGLQVMNAREAVRQEMLPKYREAALPAVNELRAKGGLSIAQELGIIKKVPKTLKDAPVTQQTMMQADAIALKSFNITESYLLEQSAREINGMPERKKPDIPNANTFTKHAATIIPAAYSQGRDETVASLVEQSRRRPEGEYRIVAEYSSVLEENTCDPCRDLDGRRAFVGSQTYEKIKPPSVCLGGNRCRCIMSYLGNEEDLAQIVEDLRDGFSQTFNPVNFSDDDNETVWMIQKCYHASDKEQ